jgi:hypothetical protein
VLRDKGEEAAVEDTAYPPVNAVSFGSCRKAVSAIKGTPAGTRVLGATEGISTVV